MTTKRRDEVLVGLLLLVAIALGLGGTIWIARGGLAKGYSMYARFPWGAGLKQGQPVLLAGVQVGFVDAVQLIPDGTIAVTLQIQKAHQVPSGTTASIKPNGIFGDQLIALQPVKGAQGYMSRGDTIPVGPGTPGTEQLLTKGDSIAANMVALTDETRSQFVTDGGIKDIRRTVADLTKLVAQLSAVATVQSAQLTKTQEQLRRTLASIDSAKVDSSLTHVQAITANFEQLSRELRETNSRTQLVMDKLANGTGTAGRLMNDPALYTRMDSLLTHIDALVLDIKMNPRKYINLKIF